MPAQFQQQIDDLRQQFIKGLPQRAHQIHELWHRLRYYNWTAQGVKSLHSLIHRLRGAGTSFGLPEITASASELDDYLQEHIDLNLPLGGVECNLIEQMINALVDQLTQQTKFSPILLKVSHLEHAANGKVIAILDDDLALSSLLLTYLKAHAFQVQQFTSAEDLLLSFQQRMPDVVLMDVGLHGEGQQGLETMEYLHAQYGELIPVIVMSARTDIQSRLRALRAGCTHYLTKPVNLDQLINSVSQLSSKIELSKRIMIVDDEEAICEIYGDILNQAGIEVLTVSQPLMALQKAIEFNPDLVVLDMHMPDVTGQELATLLREQDQFIALPIIFLTADTSPDLKGNLESLGIESVIYKPVEASQFLEIIKKTLRDSASLKNRILRVTQTEQHYQQLTRSYFLGAVENSLMNIDASENLSAIYYLGLDLDPELDASLGLQEKSELHEQFCRYLMPIIGVDEQWTDLSSLIACVLTSNRTVEFHEQRIQQMQKYLIAREYQVFGNIYTLDVAIGVSFLNRVDSVNGILNKAEYNFYKSKKYTKVSPLLSDIVQDDEIISVPYQDKEIVNFDFTNGLPLDNLCVSYQSMIKLDSARVDHFEALVRWRTGSGDLLPASRFLSSINNANTKFELDRWVLQKAVTALSSDAATREESNLFIHLDQSTLENRLFFSFATNVMRSARIRGENRLLFILDEQWMSDHSSAAQDVISALKDIHCGACLAHAGLTSGTENLIRQYRFNYVKLAPSLTKIVSQRSEERARLESILRAANEVGAKVIAAQVETPKNLSHLWQCGVGLFQGFFIHSPDLVFHKLNNLAINANLDLPAHRVVL